LQNSQSFAILVADLIIVFLLYVCILPILMVYPFYIVNRFIDFAMEWRKSCWFVNLSIC